MAKELPNITKIAVALSNHSKMLVLYSLMDKRGHTLLEIAREANIQPQTASYHLQNFINNGWVKMEKSGRFHYFFLVSDQVAALIEQFSPLSPSASTHTLTRALKVDKMRTFRSCYDHMAGKIGVLITDQLLADHLISEEPQAYQVTPDGLNFFEKGLNIDLETVQKKKRLFTVKCLDWSERKHHLGGALGNAIFDAFSKQAFVERDPNTKRALYLTAEGKYFLHTELNCQFE